MKLLSFNYQATRLLGVLISHITIHLSVFRLHQHEGRGMTNDGEKYHYVKIHESWCSSHDNSDIKGVILQGRTEPKAGLAFWSAEYNCFDPILDMVRYWSLFLQVIQDRMAWRTTRVIGIDKRTHAYSWLSIDRRGSECNYGEQLKGSP